MDPNDSPSKPEKSHKVLWIIASLVILLLILGVIGYFVNKNNQDQKKEAAKTQAATAKTNATQDFAPASNTATPYAATITSTLNGQPKSATLVSDGKGNYSYTYQADDKSLTTIYTADAYYVCTGNTSNCIKYAKTDTSGSTLDPTIYQYDSSKLESLKSTAAYKGQQTCPGGSGTCDTWQITGPNGNGTTMLFVDPTTKRIMKATYANGATTADVTYEYKNVEVAVPANATAAPAQ